MGLQTFKNAPGGKVLKGDIGVAKNYLIEKEINELFKNITSPKKFVVYENSGHENLCENEPDKWEENVGGFLGVEK